MTLEGIHWMIISMLSLLIFPRINLLVPIIKSRIALREWYSVESFWCHCFSQVPYFKQLVFAIRSHIEPITLTCNMSNTLTMANKGTCLPIIAKSSSIPDLDEWVIWSCKDYVWLHSVGKTNWVDFVIMSMLNSRTHSIRNQVINYHFSGFSSSHNLLSISREFNGHNATTTIPAIISSIRESYSFRFSV